MEKLVVTGPTPLKGEVIINGAKNAAVAILPATLLIDGTCTIENLPNISDVKISCEILEKLGAKINWIDKHTITVDSRNIIKCNCKYIRSWKCCNSFRAKSNEINAKEKS